MNRKFEYCEKNIKDVIMFASDLDGLFLLDLKRDPKERLERAFLNTKLSSCSDVLTFIIWAWSLTNEDLKDPLIKQAIKDVITEANTRIAKAIKERFS